MFIASITPEVTPDASKPWMSGRDGRVFPVRADLRQLSRACSATRRSRSISATARSSRPARCCSRSPSAASAPTASSRFRFAGRGPLLTAMLMAYMIPSVVLLVPLLVIFRSYGLINTYPGPDPGRDDEHRAVRAAADDQLLLHPAARARGGGADRRLQPAADAAARSCCRCRSRASSPAGCSPSSRAGTTSCSPSCSPPPTRPRRCR